MKKSSVHAKGLFATENIKRGSRIIEYQGEKITRTEGDRRSEKRISRYLKSKKTGSVYIFELNSKYDIDGSSIKNKARYINHSCSPNCEVEISRGKIWISSIKKIKKGDELSYDYGYEFDQDDFTDHECKCGSKNCIGYIIAKEDWKKFKKYKLKKSRDKSS